MDELVEYGVSKCTSQDIHHGWNEALKNLHPVTKWRTSMIDVLDQPCPCAVDKLVWLEAHPLSRAE